MQRLILYTLLLVCFAVVEVFAQKNASLKGTITSQNEPLAFINVGLVGTNWGAVSDETGFFEIKNIPKGSYVLQVSGVGYQTFKQKVTISSENNTPLQVKLQQNSMQLEEVVITGTLKEVSKMASPVPVEVYTPAYFQKNPTPALFEALQIVNGVRPQINCSVCNTGDIHINGMEGPYTMVLIDGMPIVSGLSTVYGLNGIPNSMVERIEVVKGPASTLYGSEAVAGLLNVITKRPDNAPLFSVDVFGTSWQEYNLDIATKAQFGNTSALLGVNYFKYGNPIDNNGDGFTDLTLQDRMSVFNKWSFGRKNNRVASLAFRYLYEDRWGGDMRWNAALHRGGDEIYGESIFTKRYELMGQYQLPIEQEKMLLSFSYNDHHQNSVYGDMPYLATQRIAFGQLTWDKKLSKKHDALFGLAMRYTYYDDNTPATRRGSEGAENQGVETFLPGLFIQDEITLNPKNTLLLGARYDYNSEHGHILSPRLNYKWSPNHKNIVRFTVGNGFRVVNLFTEEHAATTGAREVVIAETLKPEKSWNVNLNYQKFLDTSFGVISLDMSAFYTYFSNKIIADYEANPDQIIYENLNGHAVSRGFSLQSDMSFDIPLKINAGFTVQEVFEIDHDEAGKKIKVPQLLTESVSGTFTVSYSFVNPKITIDYSGNVYGEMKLPILENDFRSEYSNTYSIQNIQVTKSFDNGMEFYGGVKNLLNFTPPAYSIMRAFDPFDKNVDDPINNPNGYTFDAAYVYAPNQGIRGFLGFRYSF